MAEHLLSAERTGQTIAEWLVEALDELGNRRADESTLDVACVDEIVVRLTAQIFRPDGPRPSERSGMRRMLRAERDCIDLHRALAEAIRRLSAARVRVLPEADTDLLVLLDHEDLAEVLRRTSKAEW